MSRKYHVTLTEEEHRQLLNLVKSGKTQAYRITHAQVLLNLDESFNERVWTIKEIADAYHINVGTVCDIARRFVETGLSGALERKKQINRHHKITGDVEAQMIAIACSGAPEGRECWTLQLIADRLVELRVVDSISATAVGTTLKKNELKPWLHEEWCIPTAGAEFVADMEDVLEVYEKPYDPLRPVVCLDETSRQLIEETRPSMPARPGDTKKVDHEYRRNGVVNLFMMFEPLTGQRHVEISPSRTRVDFAHCIKKLEDEYHPESEKIILVMDHLNTHEIASLYAAYPPEEALRLAKRLEIHLTPKHGSWLDMAEIEIGVLSRQCLSGYTATQEEMEHKVSVWCDERNGKKVTVNWQFTTEDARTKLKSLYPVIG